MSSRCASALCLDAPCAWLTAAAPRPHAAQLSSASREQLGVELYGVQQQLISLHERLAATEAQRTDAEDARVNAELDLSGATQRHHAVAEENAAARERVRRHARAALALFARALR